MRIKVDHGNAAITKDCSPNFLPQMDLNNILKLVETFLH